MKLTLDHNCLIALEKNESEAPYIKKLIVMHDDKKIIIRVVGIGASERLPGGSYATNFDEFKNRFAAIGLGNVEILAPIAYAGITFVERSLSADEAMVELERRIQEVLFPRIDFTYETQNDDDEDMRRRKAKCDVLALWSHITYDGDIFVTSDRNFLTKCKVTIN